MILVVVIVAFVLIIVALNVVTTQVPYSSQECHTIPFAYTVNITECAPYAPGIIFGLGSTPAKVTCTINNLENKMGTFTLYYGVRIDQKDIIQTENVSMDARDFLSRTYYYNGEIRTCTCYASPPSYQECHLVTNYRNVTIWHSLFG